MKLRFAVLLPCVVGLFVCSYASRHLLTPYANSVPTHLRIKGMEWQVQEVGVMPHDPELIGFTDERSHIIYLDWAQGEEEEQDTLWHEIHHAMMGGADFSSQMGNGHAFIYMMTPAEIRVLKDNPQLVRYLTH